VGSIDSTHDLGGKVDTYSESCQSYPEGTDFLGEPMARELQTAIDGQRPVAEIATELY